MNFHPSKCHVMSVSNRKTQVKYNYTMLNQTLQSVDSIQYLGVNIQKNLKWDKHVNHIVSRANKSLGFVRRNLHQCPEKIKTQAYTALVRPTLEYASAVWDPHTQKHITSIEQVQRRAARFATNCRSREPGCMTQSLEHLQLLPLAARRKQSRLTHFYRTVNDHNTTVTIPSYFKAQSTRYSTRSYHSSKYIIPHTRTNIYKNSFFPRTITDWNGLPKRMMYSLSVDSFKGPSL